MSEKLMTNDEAIELLENLKVCKQAHTLFNIEKEAVDMAIEALKKRPHGEWILTDERDFPRCKFQCSVCGSRFDGHGAYRDNDTKEWKPAWNFCWNCGSDNRKQGKGRRTCGLLDDEAFWD